MPRLPSAVPFLGVEAQTVFPAPLVFTLPLSLPSLICVLCSFSPKPFSRYLLSLVCLKHTAEYLDGQYCYSCTQERLWHLLCICCCLAYLKWLGTFLVKNTVRVRCGILITLNLVCVLCSHFEGLIIVECRELDDSPLFFRLNNMKPER